MKRFSSRTRSTPLILLGTRATGFAAGQLGPVSTIRFRGVYSAECLVRPVFKYFWDRTMSRGAADAATDERAALPERNLLFDSNVSQRKGFIANRATGSLLFPSVSSFLARNRREKKKRRSEPTRYARATSVKITESSLCRVSCADTPEGNDGCTSDVH